MASKSDTCMRNGHTRVQWAMAILVSLAPFTYGLQLGWVSPMTQVLQSVVSPAGRPLIDSEISLIAGVPSVAAVVGIFILLYVVDEFGRRYAAFMIAGFQLVTWIIKLCPATFTSLLVARIFCGLGAGGCFHVVPMYIKELSQDSIRGTLGSIGTLFQNLGIFIMYILGGYLDYNIVLYLVVGLPLLNIILLLKAPESPSFLVKKGKLEEATSNVALLRGLNANDKRVLAEIDLIKQDDDYFKSIPSIKFINIFKNEAWRRGFVILAMVFTIHGSNGTFFIINYASNLLADSDVNISLEIQTLSVPVALTIGTLIAVTSVDRLGRKLLMGGSFFISALTFSGLATSMLLYDYGFASPGWLTVVAILITLCSYGAGISPVPFIVSSETFNFEIRAKLMGCLSALAWFISFIQIIVFTAISSYFGAYASFYIFGVINLLGFIITATLLPETGGKTVEQIENELRKGRKIIN